jgi:hypothetical protein
MHSGYQGVAALMHGLSGRDPRAAGRLTIPVTAGRPLDRRDVGTDHATVNRVLATPLGIHVGSIVVYRLGRTSIHLKVVGIQDPGAITIAEGTTADNTYLEASRRLS